METEDCRLFVGLSMIAGCLLAAGNAFAKPPGDEPATCRTGKWPMAVDFPPRENKNALCLLGEPAVTITDEGKVKIDFKTADVTPPATVYFGSYEPDAMLAWPRFRYLVREQPDGPWPPPQPWSTEHRVEWDLENLKRPNEDLNDVAEKGGGLVVYRIELFSPSKSGSVRLYDGRFEFYDGEVYPTVTEGPFVDQITETSAIISWETNQPAHGIVKVSGTGDFTAATNNCRHFEVPITGLDSGRTYYYSVEVTCGDKTTSTRQYFFRTPIEDASQFTFAVLGDSREGFGGGEYCFNGVNARAMRNVATQAFLRGAAFIVHTGDMINGYTDSVLDFDMQLQSYKNSVECVGHYIPIYESMGNHEAVVHAYTDDGEKPGALRYGSLLMFDKEGDESAEALIAKHFVNPSNGPEPDNDAAGTPPGTSMPPYKENVYFFDYGNCRFVVMNNNYWYCGLPEKFGGNLEGYVLDDQLAWLKDVFQKTKANDAIEHVFLFAQEPMFPNGSQVKTGMWYQGGLRELNGGIDRTYVVERRDEIWRAFVGTGKAVAANFGDEHNYSRTLITTDKDGKEYDQPVWQIIAGNAGAPYSSELRRDLPWSDGVRNFTTQIGFTLLTVDRDEVVLEGYTADGLRFDRCVLTDETR